MAFFRKILSGRQAPFIIFTMAAVAWLICLPLFQDGMFIDGVLYSSVSRNLARGVGTFWNPIFSQNSNPLFNTFHEHPPLVFFIQSLFFRLFGLHTIYPERIYGLFTFLVTALFMALIWRQIQIARADRRLWWLPIFLWVIMPVVFWSYADGIQENTMSIFTTAAVYFFLCAMDSVGTPRLLRWGIGSICILMAMMCKGVPGIFPIMFFLIYWLCLRRIGLRAALAYTAGAGLFIAALVFVILLSPTARDAMHIWFYDRMMRRIASDPVVGSHFHILIGLLTEQLPTIAIVLLALIIFRLKHLKNEISRPYFALFFLLGLTGSVPLMLTLVQRDFYFTPSLPLFAIAWAVLIAEGMGRAIDSIGQRWRAVLLIIACIALLTGISATAWLAGQPKRDREILKDVASLAKVLPENSTVTVTSDVLWGWPFRFYMMRYDGITFTDRDTCAYLIAQPTGPVDARFTETGAPLHVYRLYKIQQPPLPASP